MLTVKEIVDILFDMLWSLEAIGCLLEEERIELEALEAEWNAQNWEE